MRQLPFISVIFSESMRLALASPSLALRNPLARPKNVIIGQRLFGKAQSHYRCLAIITNKHKVVHTAEDGQVLLQHAAAAAQAR